MCYCKSRLSTTEPEALGVVAYIVLREIYPLIVQIADDKKVPYRFRLSDLQGKRKPGVTPVFLSQGNSRVTISDRSAKYLP